jgi:hypothetical protein
VIPAVSFCPTGEPIGTEVLSSMSYIIGSFQLAEFYKTMLIKMFAILDKTKPDIESIRG